MALVMVTGSRAFHDVFRRIPISAGLNQLPARGTMPASWKILGFFVYRLVTGSRAFHGVCRRIPISAWLNQLPARGAMAA